MQPHLRDVLWADGLLRVRGKTGERLVPFGARSKRALQQYINQEREAVHPSIQAVFLSSSAAPFAPTTLNTLITRPAASAGVERSKVGPHTLRHTFAVEFLRAGGNLLVLQKVLGHKSIQVTCGLNVLTEDVQEAHRRYSPVDRLPL